MALLKIIIKGNFIKLINFQYKVKRWILIKMMILHEFICAVMHVTADAWSYQIIFTK
jgi:hypothetical protein